MSSTLWSLGIITVLGAAVAGVVMESNCESGLLCDAESQPVSTVDASAAGSKDVKPPIQLTSEPSESACCESSCSTADDVEGFTVLTEACLQSCSLDTQTRDQRVAMTQQDFLSKAKQVVRLDNGYRIQFASDDDTFIREVAEWVLAERKCCSFFRFNLTFEPNGPVFLEMTGNEQAVEMLDSLIPQDVVISQG